MALRRRTGEKLASGAIWPGFVDAMTALLLVLMFVLSIFMIVQFMLRETISGKDRSLAELTAQLGELADVLASEQQRSARLSEDLRTTQTSLATAQSEEDRMASLLATMQIQRDSARARAASFEEQMTALLADKRRAEETLAVVASERDAARAQADQLTTERDAASLEAGDLQAALEEAQSRLAQLEAAQTEAVSEKDALELALARLRNEIDVNTQAARLAAAKTEAMQALIDQLRADADDKQAEDAQRLAALAASEADRDALEEQLANLTTRVAALSESLEEQMAALAAANAARENLDRSATSAQAELVELRRELDARSTDLAAREKALADAEARAGELSTNRDTLASEVAALADRVARLTADLEQKTAALADAETDRARLTEAADRIGALESELTEAEKQRILEAAAAEALRKKLEDSATELTAMTLALEEQRREAEETLLKLAAAEAARAELGQDLKDLEVNRDDQSALLAVAKAQLAKEQDDHNRTEAAREQAARERALLNAQAAQLRGRLEELQAMLELAEAEDAEKGIEIQKLGSQLNAALAREAQKLAAEKRDLEGYKSEFFGRMREVLGDRDEIKIVGDRFVFQSEVLFTVGSSQLGAAGQRELSQFAEILREVTPEIPSEVNWILQINGHTDAQPFAGGDNWELSQRRALSVLRYLIDVERIDPRRLAAAGYGEFQPIDSGGSTAAFARNRRIELKLTER